MIKGSTEIVYGLVVLIAGPASIPHPAPPTGPERGVFSTILYSSPPPRPPSPPMARKDPYKIPVWGGRETGAAAGITEEIIPLVEVIPRPVSETPPRPA